MEYYIKQEIDEHMLYASEIAQLFNVYTINDYAYSRLISVCIQQLIDDNYVQYYYQGKTLNKVYPSSIYNRIPKFLEDNSINIKDNIFTIKLNNKLYTYKKKEGILNGIISNNI